MAKEPKTFLITYHSGIAAQKRMKKASKAELAESQQAWVDWAEQCGDDLLEMGSPLKPGVNLNSLNKATPSLRKISGYSKVKAATIAGAKKLVKNHPHLSWGRGCEIEVHEIMPAGK